MDSHVQGYEQEKAHQARPRRPRPTRARRQLTSVLIGTSGWQYDHWKGLFYPGGAPKPTWLSYYAQRFQTVEVNSAFYRLPSEGTFGSWRRSVPDDFVLAVKASRYITHIKRLRDCAGPVRRLMESVQGLGDKLGPILLQLPPNLPADHGSLRSTLGNFPQSVRVALETRHPSWQDDTTRQILEVHGAAWVLVDPADQDRPQWRTAVWGYARFHGGTGCPQSCYEPGQLATWASRLAELWSPEDDIYCYFNNDGHGCAPRDARRFAAAVERAGLRPSRAPGQRETPVF